MQSPFDTKNKAATLIDRLAIRLLLLTASVGYFAFLWRSPRESLVAGLALYALLSLTLMLFERSTLAKRDRLLRERVGGAIALESLIFMPAQQANETVCALLCTALGAQQESAVTMLYGKERWLVRCCLCLRGSSASEGDVLSAHRARVEAGAAQCALATTGIFSPAAIRASEWVDPPVRLIDGRQLSALFGRLHPATDEEIAQHARLRRKPFSFARIRALALSPHKLRRYLLCAFLLLLFYFHSGSPICLFYCLLAFLLALFCHKENSRYFRL